MRHGLVTLWLVAALAGPAAAQQPPDVNARRLYLGATGSICVWRTGSGAPSGSLGSVCDRYQRTDSPYTTYVKIGASTWAELYHAGGTDVAVADGGTGRSSWTTGDLVYASAGTTLSGLSAVATGQVLASAGAGVAPSWSASPTVTALTASGALQGATVTGTTSMSTPSLLASANLSIAPTGDLVLAPTGLDILPDVNYTKNLGSLSTRFLTVHAGELWVQALVAAQTMATIGGRFLVGPTTTLTANLAAAATSMEVKHNTLASGARVVLESNGRLEWIAVTSGPSGSGPYTYAITRNLDLSGADDWIAGDAVFSTGTTGDGFIDLYSVAGVIPGSTAGPTIVGNVRTGTGYSAIAPRWAIGNLNGLYGYGATTYGAAFGDPSAANVTVDATNGVRIRNGTTNQLVADTSGNLSLVSGNLTIDTNGITMVPSAVLTPSRAYKFDVVTGSSGLFASEGSGNRVISTQANWTGASNITGTVTTSLRANHTPVSGTTKDVSFELVASGSVSTITGIAETITHEVSAGSANVVTTSTSTKFSSDFQVTTNNATSTTIPYVRSDGNYLVIESRSTAHGGNIFLGLDNNAIIVLGQGGGQTQIYHPYFISSAPRWANSLVQTTVGAAGAASALPANPVGYIKIADQSGNVYVVPAYNP